MAKAMLFFGVVAMVLWSFPYDRVAKKEANAYIDGAILQQTR